MNNIDMNRQARIALKNAGFSRRDFLKTSGALIVTFASVQAQGPATGSPSLGQLDSWIAITADGSITAYSGKEELGQGISTAQQQLVAEELNVSFERVKLIYCDTALTPDQAHTSGSQSHPTNFNHQNLALAGATAREALLNMAATRFNVPAAQLKAENGVISVANDPSKKVTYGELVNGRKFNLPLSTTTKRKHPSTWTVLGKPIARPDMAEMVTGRFEYVHNVRIPGMLHGAVVRPPQMDATLASVDESSVSSMPGLVKVVARKNFVGVVAEKPWQALQIAAKLKVNWNPGPALTDQAQFYESLKSQPSRDILLVNSEDTAKTLATATTVVESTYFHPYQMHGSIGTSCAVADVQGERATLYSGTQGVWYQKSACAVLLGLKPENIHVIFRRGSGCYGLNGADAVTYDAAILSQAAGKPVRVQLSRKDEMAWENYGHMYLMNQKAGLDAQGNIIAWEHESWIPALGNRPGPAPRPGNIITGRLLGFDADPFQPRTPAPAPTAFNNNSNGIPSYMAGRFKGKAAGAGTITSERVLLHNVRSPFFTGPLRSPARLQNTFAHESFMDELAARAGADPVEFRLRHLSSTPDGHRIAEMVREASKAAGWDARPSPKKGNARTGIVTGRGIACVAYEGDNGYSALVAEVDVDQVTGRITVKRMVASNDSGPISNPDGLRQQLEGGALQGLSRALGEEVTWDREKITSVDWRSYRSLPVGFAVPKIETILLNRPDEEATGAGETSITIVAAAVANAIFDATGARIRQIPFTPERVKAALAARS